MVASSSVGIWGDGYTSIEDSIAIGVDIFGQIENLQPMRITNYL